MSHIKNPPAFPSQQWSESANMNGFYPGIYQSGMSMVDYFAGLALQGTLASPEEGLFDKEIELAAWCYSMAECMMVAREDFYARQCGYKSKQDMCDKMAATALQEEGHD